MRFLKFCDQKIAQAPKIIHLRWTIKMSRRPPEKKCVRRVLRTTSCALSHFFKLTMHVRILKLKNIRKIEFSNFSLWLSFFWIEWLFYKMRRERQRQAERQLKIFLTFTSFFVYLNLKMGFTLANFNFQNIIQFDHFFWTRFGFEPRSMLMHWLQKFNTAQI